MKILVITGNLNQNSGLGRYSLGVVEELGRVGIEHVVLTEKSSGYAYEKDLLYPRNSVMGILKNLFLVRKQCKNFDIVHALDCWPFGIYGLSAVLGRDKKLFINGVGTYSIPTGSLLKKTLMSASYRKAKKIFCISRYTEKRIKESSANISTEVVHLGAPDVRPLSKEEKEKRELKYDVEGGPILLTVGAIKHRKGQLDALRAVNELIDEYPDIQYIMVGTGSDEEYMRRIKDFVKEKKLENNIRIISDAYTDKDLAYFYELCDVFVLTSNNEGVHFEGFGLVMLEAAQFGKPLIGSADCGIEDTIRQGFNGYLVRQEDHLDIAEKIRKAINEKLELGKNSAEFSCEFSWNKTISRYERSYREYGV